MKYVFLIQLLIITIITMFTSANILKNKTYLKNTISKSDKFNYFALLFMNITTCYIVAYFFDSSDILKIFLINLSLVAISCSYIESELFSNKAVNPALYIIISYVNPNIGLISAILLLAQHDILKLLKLFISSLCS